ncbi:MAG: SH3 domain-containing protein [Anaerolineales bacterium]
MKNNFRIAFALLLSLVVVGCGAQATSQPILPTQIFFTSTSTPPETQTPFFTQVPLNPTATLPPTDGTTTAQLNLRSEPATIGDTLAVVPAFAKIQIFGKEVNGAWYKIKYSGSLGWVTAAYVQIDSIAALPVIETGTGSGSGTSGIILQGVNVRNGPGTTYDSLGTLIQNDIVSITGKDSTGGWIQINFKGQTGWVAAEFIKSNGLDGVSVTAGESVNASPQASAGAAPSEISAIEDNDSLDAPSASVSLTSSQVRALQFNGVVSSPNGDAVDWVQFTSASQQVAAQLICSENQVLVDLYINNQPSLVPWLTCGEQKIIDTIHSQSYVLKIYPNESSTLTVSKYSIKLNIVR